MEVYVIGHSWTSLQSPSRSCSCPLPSGRDQLLKSEPPGRDQSLVPVLWHQTQHLPLPAQPASNHELLPPKAAPASSAGAVAIWTPTSS